MLNLARTVQRAAKQKTLALVHQTNQTSAQQSRTLNNFILRCSSTSQVASDFQKVIAPKSDADSFVGSSVMPARGSVENKLERGHFSSQLEDYGVSNLDAAYNFESMALRREIDISTVNEHQMHPFESVMNQERAQADVYAKLQDNQVLLTNLPIDLYKDAEILSTRDKMKAYLIETVHRDLQVKQITHIAAITAPDAKPRTAFIKVTLGTKRQAFMVQKALRKMWFSDYLLKVKTQADTKREVHGNRTILLRNIPRDFNERLIMQTFVSEEAGCITGVELPVEHVQLAEHGRDHDKYARDQKEGKTKEFESAQKVIENALREGQKHPGYNLNNKDVASAQAHLNSKAAKKLDAEKMQSLLKSVTLLQSEGAQVVESKQDLLNLLSQTVQSSSMTKGAEDYSQMLTDNKGKLQQVATYLKGNRDAVSSVTSKPIEDLMKLSQGELAHAFDHILAALTQRQVLIEKRLAEAVHHIGIEERILIQNKDFDKELEDISQAFLIPEGIRPEQIISLQQQIADVIANKNFTAEDKFLALIEQNLNPFRSYNFGDQELKNVRGEHLDQFKLLEVIDPRYNKEEAADEREGTDFQEDSRQVIDQMVSDIRGRFDMPFDELYHKERNIVQSVIKAEKALKAKQDKLNSPMQHGQVDRQAADHILGDSILKDELLPRSQAQKNRLASERVLDSSVSGDQWAASYDFKSQSEVSLQQQVEDGILSQTESDRIKQLAREKQMQNKGYVFITFSHSDEARMYLIMNAKKLLGSQEIQVDLKANVDHSELDFKYFMARSKNDAQLVDEIVNLRQVKKEMRDFESHGLEDDMPNSIKLKEFREHAKQLIENKAGFVRTDKTQRTAFEEETLQRKMRDLQARYPHVDMTQLFGTERAEDARQALHKRAFSSYKQFEFLKAGLNENGEKPESVKPLSDAKRRLQENDPYNFPALDQTVAKVLSKDVMTAQLLDNGEVINAPGRRFKGYTDQEYLEAFFGKDMMRVGVVDKKEDPLFQPQQSLKERHPLSNYLQLPAAEERLAKIKELGLDPDYLNLDAGKNPYPRDKDLAAVMKRMEQPILAGALAHDPEHEENPPLDASTGEAQYDEDLDKPIRTRLGDIEQMMEKYSENRIKRGMANTVNSREIRQLLGRIDEDYEPYQRQNDKDDFMTYIKAGEFMPRKDEGEDEVAEAPAEGQDQKFDTSYESGLSQGRRLQNKMELDDLRRTELDDVHEGEGPEVDIRQNLEDRLNKINESRELKGQGILTLEQYYEEIQNRDPIVEAHKQFKGGELLYKHSQGEELEHSSFGNHQQVKERQLKDFIRSGATNEQADDQQDEMDVFERYQTFLKRESDQSPRDEFQDNSHKMRLDPKLHQAEMPRFQDYFASQAQNVHPFDKITNKANDSIENEMLGEQSEEDQARERHLYHRELLGRLMGGKLSPRQYEQLFGQFKDQDAKLAFMKDAMQEEKFLNDRDIVRLSQEFCEKIRRKNVRSGKWTEHESVQRMKEDIREVEAAAPSQGKSRQIWRDYVEAIGAINELEQPESLLEREYFFDEGLGQSLQDHVAELKKNFPEGQIWSRRDRDGFAIVKLTFNQQYKYNIDDIESWDKDVAQDRVHAAQNSILGKMHPEGISGDLTESDLSQELQRMLTEGKIHESNEVDLDSWSRLQLQELARSIVSGKIDSEQILQRFDQISQDSKTATESNEPVFKLDTSRSMLNVVSDELEADRHQLGADMFKQMKQRVRKHLYSTERSHSDFIKPKINEKYESDRRVKAQEYKIQAAEEQMLWHQRSLDKKAEREAAQKEAEANNEEYLETTDYESDWEFDQRIKDTGLWSRLVSANERDDVYQDGVDENGEIKLNKPNDDAGLFTNDPSVEDKKKLDYIFSGKKLSEQGPDRWADEDRINYMAPSKEFMQHRKRVRGETTGRELDQDSYEQVKRDLAAAKERKQKLLSQGLPDYVPYLRL